MIFSTAINIGLAANLGEDFLVIWPEVRMMAVVKMDDYGEREREREG